jgi:putative flippase GtrA
VSSASVLNRRWTFRSRARRSSEVARFAVVQAVGLVTDVLLLEALVRDAGIAHLLAQALVFPVASCVTFILSRRWAFSDARTVQPSPSV